MGKSGSEALLQTLWGVPLLSLIVTMWGRILPAGLEWSQAFLPMIEELDPAAAHKAFQNICGVQNDDNWMNCILP